MKSFNWAEIQRLANNKATLVTKSRIPFQVVEATENALSVKVRSGEVHSINRTNLEKAVAKIHSGAVLSGPKNYRDFIADDRPAYAWAILKHLGYIEE